MTNFQFHDFGPVHIVAGQVHDRSSISSNDGKGAYEAKWSVATMVLENTTKGALAVKEDGYNVDGGPMAQFVVTDYVLTGKVDGRNAEIHIAGQGSGSNEIALEQKGDNVVVHLYQQVIGAVWTGNPNARPSDVPDEVPNRVPGKAPGPSPDPIVTVDIKLSGQGHKAEKDSFTTEPPLISDASRPPIVFTPSYDPIRINKWAIEAATDPDMRSSDALDVALRKALASPELAIDPDDQPEPAADTADDGPFLN